MIGCSWNERARMKYWAGVLRYSLYLAILSSILVPFSHTSWTQFGREFLIRLAIVVPFVAITFRILRSDTVEPYRITGVTSDPLGEEGALPAESTDVSAIHHPEITHKSPGSFLLFVAMILGVF